MTGAVLRGDPTPVSSGEAFPPDPAEGAQSAFNTCPWEVFVQQCPVRASHVGGDSAPPEGHSKTPSNYIGEAQDYIWSMASDKILSF